MYLKGLVMVRMKQDLMDNLLEQEQAFFDSTSSGQILSRLTSDIQRIADTLSISINALLRNTMTVATLLVFMFSASWRLTVVGMLVIPATLVISRVYGAFVRPREKKSMAVLAEAHDVAQQVGVVLGCLGPTIRHPVSSTCLSAGPTSHRSTTLQLQLQ